MAHKIKSILKTIFVGPDPNSEFARVNRSFDWSRRRFLSCTLAGVASAGGAASFNIGSEAALAVMEASPLETKLIAENPHIDEQVLKQIADDHRDIDHHIGVLVAGLSGMGAYRFFASEYWQEAIKDKQYQVMVAPIIGNSIFLGAAPWLVDREYNPEKDARHYADTYGISWINGLDVQHTISDYMNKSFLGLYFAVPSVAMAALAPKAEREMKDYHAEKMLELGPWG